MKTGMSEKKNEKEEEPQIEYTKVQGFDILDKLDEKKTYDSYNEKYYNSLENLKFLSISIPKENKLFYNFSQNPHASVTTTTGQCYVTYNDLKQEEQEIAEIIRSANEDISSIVSQVDNCDKDIIEEIKPQIDELEQRLRKYLVEQKTENFKLIKEVATLNKDKEALVSDLDACITRLNVLEAQVGKKRSKKNGIGEHFNTSGGSHTLMNNNSDPFKNQTYISANTNYKANNTYNTSSSDNNPKYFGDTISVVKNK